jgi:hypothetical protein
VDGRAGQRIHGQLAASPAAEEISRPPGLAASGLAASGLAASGLAASGLAASGLAARGAALERFRNPVFRQLKAFPPSFDTAMTQPYRNLCGRFLMINCDSGEN